MAEQRPNGFKIKHSKALHTVFLVVVLLFFVRMAYSEVWPFAGDEIRSSAPPASPIMAQAESRDADTGAGAPAKSGEDLLQVKLQDLELVDQDGEKVKFESDILKDRVAVIVPFYTTCTTTYPILIFMFTRLQEMLGERLGREVVLVSVSVDPKSDIPIRLKAYARRQKAKPGWIFLTGERDNLGMVLLDVGVLFTSNLEEHNHIPITLVGRNGSDWRRFHGFPAPEQILGEIDRFLPAGQKTPSSPQP